MANEAKQTECTKHCYCRSKTAEAAEFGGKAKRIRFCCWCGAERGAAKKSGA